VPVRVLSFRRQSMSDDLRIPPPVPSRQARARRVDTAVVRSNRPRPKSRRKMPATGLIHDRRQIEFFEFITAPLATKPTTMRDDV
jgi:hypothetical protein